MRAVANNVLLDCVGNCVSVRNSDYINSLVKAWDSDGGCTAFGHARGFDAAGAAVINGTAAHGEDFDDTFEGSPVHAGAPAIPAVLAACERYDRSGTDALVGAAVAMELMCRLTVVAPTAVHRAGFHPTAVIGTMGAAAGVGAALGMTSKQICDALGVAGSMASGIIEYLAEGTWTKRLHPGWAAQSGIRAALMARHGFTGPRTVFEGVHGFFYTFADPAIDQDMSHLTNRLGEDWRMEKIAFKPYACGTMAQPYIDCAIRLAAEDIDAAQVAEIRCETGEGIVHRLWEPLAEKHRPTTPYSAKFSIPYLIAVGFIDGAVGLAQFTEERIRDAEVLELASKVNYVVDPKNEYPRNYTGHTHALMKDGSERVVRQPHLRGGSREPLTREEIIAKFSRNAEFGGLTTKQANSLRSWCETLFDSPTMKGIADFRI
ncbi:MAG: MmgE/PrpD family protein [Alphaproteobacteria bacterium]|nr:MmgE/PrpD family protein [Alphaproteobacteria bacterium]